MMDHRFIAYRCLKLRVSVATLPVENAKTAKVVKSEASCFRDDVDTGPPCDLRQQLREARPTLGFPTNLTLRGAAR